MDPNVVFVLGEGGDFCLFVVYFCLLVERQKKMGQKKTSFLCFFFNVRDPLLPSTAPLSMSRLDRFSAVKKNYQKSKMFFFIKNEKKNLHIFLFYFEKKTKLKFPPQKKRIIFLFCF